MSAKYTEEQVNRFWSKVDRRGPDDCWEWTSPSRRHGYGQISIKNRMRKAHRVSWEIANGPIQTLEGSDFRGACVCHRCDNSLCVNPSHLFIGTHADNVRDMVSKKRSIHPAGIRNGRAMFTEEDILAIRKRLSAGESCASIAKDYSVTRMSISRIKRGECWTTTQCAS